MLVHPALAALRSDRASQRLARQTLEALFDDWRSDPLTRRLAVEIAAHDRGMALAQCEALDNLLRDPMRALGWITPLIDAMIAALRKHPLAEVPLRARSSDGGAAVRLLEAGGTSLTLSAHSAPTRRARLDESAPQTVLFADRTATELVLAGDAQGTRFHLTESAEGPDRLTQCERVWRTGERIELTAACARWMVPEAGGLLLLQLTRLPATPRPTRQFCLRTGALLNTASGDKRASRDQLALAVLGALEHGAGLTTMEQVAQQPTKDADLRWEAVRQVLAFDPVRGMALLSSLASRSDDPLALPARRLRQQLLAAHPQLAERAA